MTNHDQAAITRRRDNPVAHLGSGAVIDMDVVLGYPPSNGDSPVLLVVGPHARVRRCSVIYAGSRIGSNLETGHNVLIREQNTIGDNFRIWSNSIIDYGCSIGNNVKIHSNVYVSQFTVIEDDVFIGPGVGLANDVHPGCPNALKCMRGPIIKRGAQIGMNSCILPRVTVGEYAVIGAGSVVTHDIPPGVVAYGNPAEVKHGIETLVCINGFRDKPYNHLTGRMQDVCAIRGPQETVPGSQERGDGADRSRIGRNAVVSGR